MRAAVEAAVNLAGVFAAGVSPAEAAGCLDRATLARLVPRLPEPDVHDLARFFADPRVQQMLDQAWQAPPRGEPLLAETLVQQLVERADLVRLIYA